MSRSSRKIRRKQQQQKQVENMQEITSLKEKIQQAYQEEDYAGVINTLAELVQDGSHDASDLYLGAQSYFMLGDYMRAARMVETILNLAPGHVDARILLARICVLEDRTDDGLAIFDFILEHYEATLTTQQREDIEDILEYYGHNESERLCADFPHIAAFLHLAGADEAQAPAREIPVASAEPAQPAATVQPVVAPVAPEQPVATPAAEAPVVEPAAVDDTAQAEIAQIRQQQVSVAEKIRLCQAFAGAHYVSGDLAGAEALLMEALGLDGQDAGTLRNLAVLLKRQGQADKALALAAKLPETDFLLLDFLCH